MCVCVCVCVFTGVCIVVLIRLRSSHRFVIELCEPIQVKRLDIANFELFSSTPKDFLVSISDRFGTPIDLEWRDTALK